MLTDSVNNNPPNFPSRNSHRRTGLANSAYKVRLSISLETSPTPINTAINRPITEIALNPRLTITICSMPIEICPTRIAAPIINSAKKTRLYSTRSRTAREMYSTRLRRCGSFPAHVHSGCLRASIRDQVHEIFFQRGFHLRHGQYSRAAAS